MSNPFNKQAPIKGVQHIVAVGSGKGGVGKSFVALNLAVALAKQGLKTGVLDADLYGPSLPRMTGTLYSRPELGSEGKLLPLRRFGVSLLSMGHLVEEESPLVWRGPMLFKALEQFLRDVHWGDLNALVVDLPPGTGDVALTIAQKVPVSGGLVVSTPQDLSLIDTRKAINMFAQVGIPVIGLVENMSYYRGEEGKKHELFPKGRLNSYLKEKKVEKLAEIPFHPHAGLSAEAGVPLLESYPDSVEGAAVSRLGEKVKLWLERDK